MTLCVLWKQDGNVHFASDSRLTLGSNSYTDIAIKVMTAPYTIHAPLMEGEENKKVIYTGDVGICFAGSAINSLFIKETVSELLKNLQFVPDHTDLTIRNLALLVFKVYKKISEELCSTILREKGISEFFLTGLLPNDDTAKTYCFSTDPKTNIHTYKEILLNEGEVIFSGTGKVKAEEIKKQKNKYYKSELSILADVIFDDDVPSVGGNIQYGRLTNCTFKTYGVHEIVSYTESGERTGKTNEVAETKVHYWRGCLDLNSPEFSEDAGEFILSYQYLDKPQN